MIGSAQSVDVRRRVVNSPDELVGQTPLMRLSMPGIREDVRLLAKLEMFNPLSSVKDRAALRMLQEAERTGLLPATGGTVIETTSGNTGISLAALCAVRGHRCIIVMPDNASAERRSILGSFGAEVVESPHQDGLPAAIELGERIHRGLPGSWLVGQHRNPANVLAHYETTGPEIWDACGGEVDAFVCGVGTGGTLTGVARYLRERATEAGRSVHIVAVEPAGSPVLSGGEPGPHRIPGIGGGFINPVTDVSCIDQVIAVDDDDAAQAVSDLARHSGLLAGISSGAALHAARTLAGSERWADRTVVTLLPDTGERYLSLLSDAD